MKFRIASLLSLLSGVVLLNVPAISMQEEDLQPSSSPCVTQSPGEKRGDLKEDSRSPLGDFRLLPRKLLQHKIVNELPLDVARRFLTASKTLHGLTTNPALPGTNLSTLRNEREAHRTTIDGVRIGMVRGIVCGLLTGNKGYTKNPPASARFNSQFADKGDSFAVDWKIDSLVRGNNGYKQDPEEASKLTLKAAETGNITNIRRAIHGYKYGVDGFPLDPARAQEVAALHKETLDERRREKKRFKETHWRKCFPAGQHPR